MEFEQVAGQALAALAKSKVTCRSIRNFGEVPGKLSDMDKLR